MAPSTPIVRMTVSYALRISRQRTCRSCLYRCAASAAFSSVIAAVAVLFPVRNPCCALCRMPCLTITSLSRSLKMLIAAFLVISNSFRGLSSPRAVAPAFLGIGTTVLRLHWSGTIFSA